MGLEELHEGNVEKLLHEIKGLKVDIQTLKNDQNGFRVGIIKSIEKLRGDVSHSLDDKFNELNNRINTEVGILARTTGWHLLNSLLILLPENHSILM